MTPVPFYQIYLYHDFSPIIYSAYDTVLQLAQAYRLELVVREYVSCIICWQITDQAENC